jgi:hypothetical protein
MSSNQIAVSAVEGRVLCDVAAAKCRCAKDGGHVEAGDPIHACDPRECEGQWVGDIDGSDFRPVVMPRRVEATR